MGPSSPSLSQGDSQTLPRNHHLHKTPSPSNVTPRTRASPRQDHHHPYDFLMYAPTPTTSAIPSSARKAKAKWSPPHQRRSGSFDNVLDSTASSDYDYYPAAALASAGSAGNVLDLLEGSGAHRRTPNPLGKSGSCGDVLDEVTVIERFPPKKKAKEKKSRKERASVVGLIPTAGEEGAGGSRAARFLRKFTSSGGGSSTNEGGGTTAAASNNTKQKKKYVSCTKIVLQGCSSGGGGDHEVDGSGTFERDDLPPTPSTPLSPSHCQQPPTPDHPPPSSVQARDKIGSRMRPISQVRKGRETEHVRSRLR